jgi:hypothetical protein
MGVKNYTLSDITKRIMLTLPARFTREEQSNVYKFFDSIADVFKLDTDKIDELITQTNLETASGAYLDQYISGLAGFGRLNSSFQSILETEDEFDIIDEDGSRLYLPDYNEGLEEDDNQYRDRYNSVLFDYNSTRQGLRQVIVDFTYEYPVDMYAGAKRGAYYSIETLHAKNYFNDPSTGRYGAGGDVAFIGYIELTRRPQEELIDILCKHLTDAKAWGIKLYLKYPTNVIELDLVETVIARDPLILANYSQSETVTSGDSVANNQSGNLASVSAGESIDVQITNL